MSKPCYIEMASEESDVENRYRCDESELNDTLPSPIDAEIRAQGQNVTVTFFTAINLTEAGIQMIGGDLPVTRFFYGLGDIVNDIDKIDGEHSAEYQDAIRKSYVQITEGGTWFFDYSAHAMSSRDGVWTFNFRPDNMQKENDYVQIGTWKPDRWYKAGFTSHPPNVKSIDSQLFIDWTPAVGPWFSRASW